MNLLLSWKRFGNRLTCGESIQSIRFIGFRAEIQVVTTMRLETIAWSAVSSAEMPGGITSVEVQNTSDVVLGQDDCLGTD
jgi:hypothetical protein